MKPFLVLAVLLCVGCSTDQGSSGCSDWSGAGPSDFCSTGEGGAFAQMLDAKGAVIQECRAPSDTIVHVPEWCPWLYDEAVAQAQPGYAQAASWKIGNMASRPVCLGTIKAGESKSTDDGWFPPDGQCQ